MKFYPTLIACALIFLASCQDSVERDSTAATKDTASNPPGNTAASAEPPSESEPVTFVLTGSSKLEWTGNRGSESLQGGFSNFIGKFEVRDGQLVPSGKHFVTIDMASVYSDKPELTETLKGPGGFDVIKYPIARFQIQKATLIESEKYELSGILDLHGSAQKINVPATVSVTGVGTLLEMHAEFSIKRSDFGIGDGEIRDGETLGSPLVDELGLKVKLGAMPGEPKELVLMDKSQPDSTEERPRRGMSGKGIFGTEGKGRPDWRNMSEEDREKMRRERMAQIDVNKDGMIGKDEVPPQAWEFMSRFDKNGDDKLDEEERQGIRADFEARRQMRELSGEEGSDRPPGFGPPRGERGDRGNRSGGDSSPSQSQP